MDWKGFTCKTEDKDGKIKVNNKSILTREDMKDIRKIVLHPRDESVNKKVEIDVQDADEISFVKRHITTPRKLKLDIAQNTHIVRIKKGDMDLNVHIAQSGEIKINTDFNEIVR